MNEFIGMGVIFVAAFVIGAAYAIGNALMTAIFNYIKCLIKFRKTMKNHK